MTRFTFDKEAILGVICGVFGALICAAIWDWRAATFFYIGSLLGSIRVKLS